MIRFRVLGTPLVERAAPDVTCRLQLQPKQLALLAYLCVEGFDRTTRRDQIVYLLWPTLDQTRARAALNQAIYRLRHQMGATTIVSLGHEAIGVDRSALWCDVAALEECLGEGRIDEALALYAGRLLEGFHLSETPDFEQWLDGFRERLRTNLMARVLGAAEAAGGRGDPAAGIRWLRRAVEISPLEEDAVRRLVLLLDQSGDAPGAVRVYERFARRLAEEYDLVPSPETTWAVASIRARMTPAPRVPTPESALPRSIVVLPFRNATDRPAGTVLCDGLTEEVIGTLGRVEQLHVIARSSASRLHGAMRDVVEIGRGLDVDAVLEGSVQMADDRVRVHARLVGCRRGALLWSRTYDRRLTVRELFAVQAEVARAITNALRIELVPAARERLCREPTADLEAYSLCVRGRHAWSRRSPGGLEEARRLFRRAIRRDPAYALAWSGLADTMTLMPFYALAEPTAARRAARRAAVRAIELDEGLAEAHAALARILEAERRWDESDREFRRALELNPNYATARMWYANHLLRRGRSGDGLREIEKAVRLDPLSPAVWMVRAFVLYLLRRYEEAIACARRVTTMEPATEGAHVILVLAQVEGGVPRQAVETCEELRRAVPDSGRLRGVLAYATARAGARARARTLLHSASGTAGEPLVLAMTWTALGDHDAAFRLLGDVDWDTTNVDMFALSPAFDPLRNDPRYISLRRRLGLDDTGAAREEQRAGASKHPASTMDRAKPRPPQAT